MSGWFSESGRGARVVLAVLAGGIACGGATDPAERTDVVVQVAADAPFQLRAGEIASLGTDGLMIAFRRVEGDSRCPSDVTCVWSGDAKVVLDLTVGRAAWTGSAVHTHVEPRTVTFRDYRIELLDLAPYPVSTQQIQANDYVATLEIRQNR